MGFDWRGRVAVVTGVSSGIGRRTAVDLARRGTDLVVCARREPLLAEVARECEGLGVRVEALAGDVAERAFVESLAGRAVERFGRLDVVVNNAGVSKHKQIYQVTADELEYVMRVNFLAPAWLTLAALPAMLRQGEGYVVNVSSMAGKIPPPREAVYAASKFALDGFTEGLWLDLEGSNVHCAVVNVGPIDTEIWAKTDEPTRYRGKKYPPSVISDAIVACVEQRRHEIFVPRTMALTWLFRVLFPGAFRRGAGRWDPVPPEVVTAARQAAGRS